MHGARQLIISGLLLGETLTLGCKTATPGFCETSADCSGNTPFCDVLGQYPESKGIGKTCIGNPFDAGLVDASVADASSPDANPVDAMNFDAALPATLVAIPTNYDFGNVTSGNVSATATFLFRNDGGSSSSELSASISDTVNFEVVDDQCSGIALAIGDGCRVDVRFTPSGTGTKGSVLLVGDGNGASAQAALTGTSVAIGDINITPAAPSFGSIEVGTQGTAVAFAVRNVGGSSTGLLQTSLGDTSNFAVAVDNCAGQVLNANNSCTIELRFTPGRAGNISTTLTVSAIPGGTAVASIGGTGTSLLTVDLEGNGTGTVSSSPSGINCPAVCMATVTTSSSRLTAIADSTSSFSGWLSGGCSGTTACDVSMTSAQVNVRASFRRNTITLNSITKREGDYGSTIFSFPLRLNTAADHNVTVNYTTAGGIGTATANEDYLVVTDSIVFAPGQTTKTIDIIVFSDKRSETNETFVLTLSSATGAELPNQRTVTGTIQDDDAGLDLNNDGFADLAIGAYKANEGGGVESGATYIYFGQQTVATSMSASDANIVLVGEDAGDWFGLDVSGGDVNGDGKDDLIVGARNDDSAGVDAGAVYVFLGPLAGPVLDASSADIKITGANAGDHFGIRIAAADVNADGLKDILVGARDDDDGGSNAGTGFVFFGSTSLAGTLDTTAAAVKFVGGAAGDGFGFSIANAGDINGDGLEDVIVGATDASNGSVRAGAAYVFYGKTTWAPATVTVSNADVTILGTNSNQNLGFSVAGGADVNNDGRDDIIVSEFTGDGAAYIFFGRNFAANQSISTTSADFSFIGSTGGNLGFTVDAIGDVNADGIPDMVVGAPAASQIATNAGRAYVILGSGSLGGIASESSTSVLPIRGPTSASANFGAYSSIALDFNRDGSHDFALGTRGEVLPNSPGTVYLFLGTSSGPLNTIPGSTIVGSANGNGFGNGLQ